MSTEVSVGKSARIRVAVSGFGKHPAWSDHISGVGNVVSAVTEFRRTLYLDGIEVLLSRWAALPDAARQPLNHWVVAWASGGFLLARVIASRDRLNRADYPFVLAVHVMGATPLQVLRRLVEPVEVLMSRCAVLESQQAVLASLESAEIDFEARLADSGQVNRMTSSERESLAQAAGLVAEPVRLARLDYFVETAWAPFAPRSGGHRPKSVAVGVSLRLPSVEGRWLDAILAWDLWIDSRVHSEVERTFIVPASGDWLDLVIGPVEPQHWACLRMNRSGLKPESDVPHDIGAEELAAAPAALEAWISGSAAPPTCNQTRSDAMGKWNGAGLVRRSWPIAAMLMLAMGGWFGFQSLRKADPAVRQRAQVIAAVKKGDYKLATQVLQEWLEKERDNSWARSNLAVLKSPPVLKIEDVELDPGATAKLPVAVVDPLERPVKLELQSIGGGLDRLEERTDGWHLTAGSGAPREYQVRVVARREDAVTTNVLRVRVREDAVASLARKLDSLIGSRQYTEALAVLADLQGKVPLSEENRSLRARILQPPTVRFPTNLGVVAGKSVGFALEIEDVLSRTVWIAPLGRPTIGGLVEGDPSDIRHWSFQAPSELAAEGSQLALLAFQASHGQGTNRFEIPIRVEPDPIFVLRRSLEVRLASAHELLKATDWVGALQELLEIQRIRATNQVSVPGLEEVPKAIAKITQAPRLRVAGSFAEPVGTIINGEVRAADGFAPLSGLVWKSEVDATLPKGQIVVIEKGSLHWTWSWQDAPASSTEATIRFRAVSAVATSEWAKVTVALRDRRLPQLSGLPSDFSLVAGEGSRTSFVFQVTGALNPLTSPLRVVPKGPVAEVVSESEAQWRLQVGAGSVPGDFSIELPLQGPEGSLTNRVMLHVREAQAVAVANPQHPSRRYWNLTNYFVWVGFPPEAAEGGAWLDNPERGLWAGKTEVPQWAYRSLLGALPPNQPGSSDLMPVVNVTPAEAEEFCRRMTEKAGLPTGWIVRLPRVEEWRVYSADGLVKGLDPVWGIDPNQNPKPLREVDLGLPGPFGLKNVIGNIGELSAPPSTADPVPWILGRKATDRAFSRVQWSTQDRFTQPDPFVGFRVVVAPTSNSP